MSLRRRSAPRSFRPALGRALAPALLCTFAALATAQSAADSFDDPVSQGISAMMDGAHSRALELLGRSPNDPTAAFLIGVIHEKGLTGTADLDAARRCYEVAAEGRCSAAHHALAKFHFRGLGVPVDLAAAYGLLKAGALLGHVDCQFIVAGYHCEGFLGEKDLVEGVAWCRVAERAGHAEAGSRAGEYAKGLSGADLDRVAARVSAIEGEIRAELDKGPVHQVSIPLGELEPEGVAVAAAAVEAETPAEAAALESFADELEVALGFYDEEQYGQALQVFSALARRGSAEACFYLGRMNEQGYGMPQDAALAAVWYSQSARGGVATASHNLAYLYSEGRGVGADPTVATDLFLHAFLGFQEGAALNVGYAFGTGNGRPLDLVEACAFYLIAAEQEADALAQQNLQVVQRQLTEEQRARAAARAQEIQYQRATGSFPAELLPEIPDLMQAAAAASGAPNDGPTGPPVGNGPGLPGRNPVEAIVARAEQGDARAQTELGGHLRVGHLVSKQPESALYWFNLAARQGHAPAMVALGEMWARGEAGAVNAIESWAWFALANRAGDRRGQDGMSGLERLMSAQDLEIARARAGELLSGAR